MISSQIWVVLHKHNQSLHPPDLILVFQQQPNNSRSLNQQLVLVQVALILSLHLPRISSSSHRYNRTSLDLTLHHNSNHSSRTKVNSSRILCLCKVISKTSSSSSRICSWVKWVTNMVLMQAKWAAAWEVAWEVA